MPLRPKAKVVRRGAVKPAAAPVVAKPAPRPDPTTLKVVLYPDPVLKKRAVDVPAVDDWHRAVVKRMVELMVEEKGVGLAAPQVGLGIRLFVIAPSGKPEDVKVFFNPVLTEREKACEEGEEGCLSLPDIRAKIERQTLLHVAALDENGQKFEAEFEGWPARIIQHENDHLNGVLIIDRMSPMARLANRKKIRELEAGFEGK